MATAKQLQAHYCNNKTLTLMVMDYAKASREAVETIKVAGKREARKIAGERGAICWNF